MLPSVMQRRIRISAGLLFAGLLIELLALNGLHPMAFLIFALAGVPLVGAGILVFLYSLVSVKE
jgi:uncharacterized membrane protein YdcZ (DUF606 family)